MVTMVTRTRPNITLHLHCLCYGRSKLSAEHTRVSASVIFVFEAYICAPAWHVDL